MLRSQKRKEMRSSIKKSWILDKAGVLFWEKGYHSTGMRDIASACECKPANIYNYFKGKEDILFEVIREITEQAVMSIKFLEDDEETDPVEQLRSLVKSHFRVLMQLTRSNKLISDTGLKDLSTEHRKEIIELRDKYDSIMLKVLRRGIKSDHFSVKDEKVIVYLISSIIVRSTIWFSPKGKYSADEIGDMMADFAYRAIKA